MTPHSSKCYPPSRRLVKSRSKLGNLDDGSVTNSVAAMVSPALALLLSLVIGSPPGHAAEFPQAKISNGQITAKIYLPDAKNGYYRSTRFDWSGAVYSLQYKGHDFYGPWFDRIDPKVINWVFQGPDIVSGPCSALEGPVDEFQTVLGWEDAKPGGTFIKIGVGVLRKTGTEYNRYFPYEVVNPGKWSVEKHTDSIVFQQDLSDPASGYGYVYRKIVRLVKGQPEMVIERSLKNTGKLRIQSTTYDHNFVVLDKQPPGPDFTFKVPYQIQSPRPPKKEQAEVRGNEIIYNKTLSGEDQVAVPIQGFSDNAKDNEIVIENKKVCAGVRVKGDRPLIRNILWSIRTVLADEPYIAIDVQPGNEFTWKNTFEYYVMETAYDGNAAGRRERRGF
jgi:hypothetical protein